MMKFGFTHDEAVTINFTPFELATTYKLHLRRPLLVIRSPFTNSPANENTILRQHNTAKIALYWINFIADYAIVFLKHWHKKSPISILDQLTAAKDRQMNVNEILNSLTL
ncbi:MAG: hypothetical protein CMK04_12715 [Ponticaulis sp.]|nr:hypothetical protein [Ponticaulis sp.]